MNGWHSIQSDMLASLGPLTARGISAGLIALALLTLAASLTGWLGSKPHIDTIDRRHAWLISVGLIAAALSLVVQFLGEVFVAEWLEPLAMVMAIASCVSGLGSIVHAWRIIPALASLPTRRELESRLTAGQKAIDALTEQTGELRTKVADSARQVAEVRRRFELALRGSPIFVYSQDRDLRYVWMHNPPAGMDAEVMVGKSDYDIIDHSSAEKLTAFKRKAMETGITDRSEFLIEIDQRPRWFDIVAEPYHVDGELAGVLCVAVDITWRKRREVQMKSALREMTHRSKNLLAVLLGIARQTALGAPNVEMFMSAFSARLLAMSITQDLLVASDWSGVCLEELIRAQADPYLAETSIPVTLGGPHVKLAPEPAQNLGLAIHELLHNAATHGALRNQSGRIDVHWQFTRAEGRLVLELHWIEEGVDSKVMQRKRGFGTMMLLDLIPRALDGRSLMTIEKDRVKATILINASYLTFDEEPGRKGDVEPVARTH